MKLISILKWVGLIHEIFHWIPAKILTTNVKLHADRVEYDLQDQQWKNLLIASGPLIVGLIVWLYVLYGVSRKKWSREWLKIAGLYVGSSSYDIRDLIYFARHKEWKINTKAPGWF